jgi:hypothetical protein
MNSELIGGKDKRQAQRWLAEYPVAVKLDFLVGEKPATVTATVTTDISSTGVSFEFDSPMEVGSDLELVLTLAEATVGGEPVLLNCRGKVVRVDRISGNDKFGIAVRIEKWN